MSKLRLHTMIDASRVASALHEAGYPDLRCHIDDDGYVAIRHKEPNTPIDLPHFVAWKAFAVAGIAVSCWPCFRHQRGAECNHPIDVMAKETDG